MKFDFVIGNPPYQDETTGDNVTFAPPVYHKFLDAAYQIADKVEMIHPARFLSNAGNTPGEWNEKMLNDVHFKILLYEKNAIKIFPNTDIKGGVVISYHDLKKNFGAIKIFTPYEELSNILKKVINKDDFASIKNIVITRTAYRLTDKMHEDHPEALSQLSNGHAYDMSTNIFERLPQIFYNNKPNDQYCYIRILGRENNERKYKYIREDYINKVINLDKYKVFLPSANGNGKLGEVFANPMIGKPKIGSTETFISIGMFQTQNEADNLMKYLKTKFSRILLGVLKTTQHLTPDKWEYVPIQDFTENSDIDWNKTIAEIDRQLYKKYHLSEAEIDFIETHAKEME